MMNISTSGTYKVCRNALAVFAFATLSHTATPLPIDNSAERTLTPGFIHDGPVGRDECCSGRNVIHSNVSLFGDDGNHSQLSSAEKVKQIYEMSGLTIEQVARLFRVSRRSIHNWINGNPMISRHEERAALLYDKIRSLGASNPDMARNILLDSAKGSSIFHQLVNETRDGEIKTHTAIALRDRVGL